MLERLQKLRHPWRELQEYRGKVKARNAGLASAVFGMEEIINALKKKAPLVNVDTIESGPDTLEALVIDYRRWHLEITRAETRITSFPRNGTITSLIITPGETGSDNPETYRFCVQGERTSYQTPIRRGRSRRQAEEVYQFVRQLLNLPTDVILSSHTGAKALPPHTSLQDISPVKISDADLAAIKEAPAFPPPSHPLEAAAVRRDTLLAAGYPRGPRRPSSLRLAHSA
ncbi:MAG TPA: hypothetical protein VN711_01335 [Candidatus Saccharimonadales bacterium]|nr:hypothetical protein [Candidatus Saccharimonadales bacterium]